MQRSFQIALQTGLRENDTIIDLRRQIEWDRARISIPEPKGGFNRAFTFEVMQMSILSYLRQISRTEDWTWRRAETGPTPIGVVWRHFFNDLGMPDIHFHCTRVTFITWCHRNGLPETIVMQLVNHASTEIHRIYQRLNAADVRRWRDQVADPHVARLAQ
jgi:integrase